MQGLRLQTSVSAFKSLARIPLLLSQSDFILLFAMLPFLLLASLLLPSAYAQCTSDCGPCPSADSCSPGQYCCGAIGNFPGFCCGLGIEGRRWIGAVAAVLGLFLICAFFWCWWRRRKGVARLRERRTFFRQNVTRSTVVATPAPAPARRIISSVAATSSSSSTPVSPIPVPLQLPVVATGSSPPPYSERTPQADSAQEDVKEICARIKVSPQDLKYLKAGEMEALVPEIRDRVVLRRFLDSETP